MKTQIIVAGFSLLSFMFPLRAMAGVLNYSKLYVFGDSLSDTGNVYNVTNAANLISPGFTAVDAPSPPYYQGRYSNGSNWIDDLASALELTVTPSTQLAVGGSVTQDLQLNYNYGGATATKSVDFAFGGATSGFENAGSPLLPGILREVQSFTDDLKVAYQSADPNALYIVWEAGDNDYVNGPFSDPEQPTTNIVQAVTSLYDAGARHILVANEPNLGLVPSAVARGSAVAQNLTQLSSETNAELKTKLNDLSSKLSGIHLVYLDVNALFQSAVTNPTAFGLTNVTSPCLAISGNSFSICENPDNYLFWDDRHPTAKAYQQIANFALKALLAAQRPQPVPEHGEKKFRKSRIIGEIGQRGSKNY